MLLIFIKNPAARARPNAGSAALTLDPGSPGRIRRRSPDRTPSAPASKGLRREGSSIIVRMLSAYPILRDAFVRGSRLIRGRWLGSSLALVCLNWGSSGCAAAHFDGQVFRQGDVAFRLEHLPPSWRNIEISDTALAFRDDENASTVAINGRCGKDAEDVPLRSLTQHLFLQFTERRLEEQELFPLDGREALRTQMVAKLDGVEKYFHVVVLKKDGCVYDFLQIANGPQDTERFLHFVRGFSSLS
jgi:hypothetical protein